MRYCFLLFFLCSAFLLKAQFGLTTFANLHEGKFSIEGSDFQSDNLDFKVGGEVALHYWFRLKAKRIEFQPTVFYASAKVKGEEFAPSLTEFGLQFKTNFYLFDFGTDCDCPTFGKQGPSLEKGFFIQLSPGYSLYRFKIPGFDTTNSSGGFTIGGGAGIDFGLSNLLTITPLAGVRYGFGNYLTDEFTDINGNPVDGKSRLLTFQIGLQATFRLDKRRY